MIVTIVDKPFRLNKFPAVTGRRLMTCGDKARNLFDKTLEDWLPFLSYVDVGLGGELWIPLSTSAMVENHVPKAERAKLLLAVLELNCYMAKEVISGPTLADALWAELVEAVEDGFKWAY